MKSIVAVFAGGLVTTAGGVIVALVSDARVRKREKQAGIESRKRHFCASLSRLRADMRQHVGRFPVTFPERYADAVLELRYEARLISGDFSGDSRTKFEQLVDTASGYSGAQASDNQDQQRILADIQAIIAHVDAA